MEAPPEPRSRRRARALPPQHGPAMASHVASTWPRPCCTAQPPPAALYARTTVRLRLWVPSMGTDKMPVRPGRPCAAMAMATRLMAETGMMMPASGSDGSCWSKVAEMQQLRMPPHERQWSTTLLPLSRSRTPPSRSQHIDCCTLVDRVAAGISLLGRGCGALGAERGNKTSERAVSTFCPLLDPPRFRSSHSLQFMASYVQGLDRPHYYGAAPHRWRGACVGAGFLRSAPGAPAPGPGLRWAERLYTALWAREKGGGKPAALARWAA